MASGGAAATAYGDCAYLLVFGPVSHARESLVSGNPIHETPRHAVQFARHESVLDEVSPVCERVGGRVDVERVCPRAVELDPKPRLQFSKHDKRIIICLENKVGTDPSGSGCRVGPGQRIVRRQRQGRCLGPTVRERIGWELHRVVFCCRWRHPGMRGSPGEEGVGLARVHIFGNRQNYDVVVDWTGVLVCAFGTLRTWIGRTFLL